MVREQSPRGNLPACSGDQRYAAQMMYAKSLLSKAATALQLVNLARRVAIKRRVGAAAGK